jgi:uncharacterized membrane protein
VVEERVNATASVAERVNRIAVRVATLLLATGLVIWFASGEATARPILDAGLVALMSTPVFRLATTLATQVRQRDWLAVTTTIAVILVLGVSVAVALRRSP